MYLQVLCLNKYRAFQIVYFQYLKKASISMRVRLYAFAVVQLVLFLAWLNVTVLL